MKTTGIVRRTDELGCAAIPKATPHKGNPPNKNGSSFTDTLTQDFVFCIGVEPAAQRYIGK